MKQIADLLRSEPRRSMLAVLVLGAAVLAGACETSSTISAGPDPVKCQVALGTMPMVEATGGTNTLAVTTQPECAWEASTTANWISGLSPASGQGTGNVAFRVGPNEGTSSRDGIIVVNGQQVVVTQRAACRYTLTPASQNVSGNGGDGSINVATADECAWTASTDVSWISLDPPLTGSGNGTVSFAVAANPGAARSGSVIVAGQRSTVTQGAVSAPSPVCSGAIAPTSQAIGATGGAGTPVTVSAQAGCQWTAVSNASWITVTSGASGTGPGAVGFSVAANTGAARTGTLTIATLVFTVTQAAGSSPPPPPSCTYALSSSSQTVPAIGGPLTVGVTAGGGCTWTGSSNAAWITITSGATGTGNGSVAFTVAANVAAARTGTLTIAGQTFTVNQEAFIAPPPCTYSISPTSQNVDANASTGTVGVTAGSGCAWTATSNAPWITITSGASGGGNGSVAFSVAANTGGARTGTATIAGQVFTVNQAAVPAPPPCTYAIAPASQNFPVLGGSGSVSVTATGSNCSWTATSGAPWITVTSGSPGNGNGSVAFVVLANVGAARSGTIAIADKVFTVTQVALLGGVR